MCLLTKSAWYQKKVEGLKIPISSLNYVINHCATLQMNIEIVHVYEKVPREFISYWSLNLWS